MKCCPLLQKEKLADYIDVFCEKVFFNPEESETILKAGMQHVLQAKIHVNQIHSIGGIETGIRLNVLSMDHLETMPVNDLIKYKKCGWKGFLHVTSGSCAFFFECHFRLPGFLLESGAADCTGI